MKKSLKFLIPSMFGLLVAGCSLDGTTPINKGDNIETNKARLDAVAVDSYTTSIILDSLDEVSTSTDVENPETPENPENPDETPSENETVDENLVIVNNYIKLFDTLTSGDGLTVDQVASDKEEYKFKAGRAICVDHSCHVTETDKKRPLIYLAGFERYNSNGEEVFARMKEICAKYGYEAISPLDRAPGVQETSSENPYMKAMNLFDRFQQHVRNCDLIIANLFIVFKSLLFRTIILNNDNFIILIIRQFFY